MLGGAPSASPCSTCLAQLHLLCWEPESPDEPPDETPDDSSEREMDVSLIMFTGNLSRREFPVTKARVVIGRINSCDLRIPLSSVSRKHCELKVVRGSVKVNDLGSSNGTYVNGSRIRGETSLHPGDRVQVGPIIFTLVIDGVPAVEQPSESLVDAQVDAERKTGDIISPNRAVAQAVDEKTTPPKPGEDVDDVLEDLGDELLQMSGSNLDDSAAIVLPDDDDEDEDDAKPAAAAKDDDPDSAGSSVLEEFDDMLGDIEQKITSDMDGADKAAPSDDAAEDSAVEELSDDDVVDDEELVGEVDEGDDDEEAVVLTDDDVDENDEDDLPVLGDDDAADDDPVAALQSMSSPDDSSTDDDDDIDLSWLGDDDTK